MTNRTPAEVALRRIVARIVTDRPPSTSEVQAADLQRAIDHHLVACGIDPHEDDEADIDDVVLDLIMALGSPVDRAYLGIVTA